MGKQEDCSEQVTSPVEVLEKKVERAGSVTQLVAACLAHRQAAQTSHPIPGVEAGGSEVHSQPGVHEPLPLTKEAGENG